MPHKGEQALNNNGSKIYIFYCANNPLAMELAGSYREGTGELKVIALPCSGKIDIRYLTKAFETGADGVVVLTCEEAECQYLEGNLRARKRVESIGALLEEVGMGRGRAAVIQIDGDKKKATAELRQFCTMVEGLSTKAQVSAKAG